MAMKKEDIMDVGQLLGAMRDIVGKLKEAQKKGDGERVAAAKKEILIFQKKLAEIL